MHTPPPTPNQQPLATNSKHHSQPLQLTLFDMTTHWTRQATYREWPSGHVGMGCVYRLNGNIHFAIENEDLPTRQTGEQP